MSYFPPMADLTFSIFPIPKFALMGCISLHPYIAPLLGYSLLSPCPLTISLTLSHSNLTIT